MNKTIKVISHIYTGKSLTVVYTDPAFHTEIVQNTHPNWKIVDRLYRAGKIVELVPYLNVAQAVNQALGGKFVISGNTVLYNGKPIHGYLFDRILHFLREGLPYKRLVKFAENLYLNPSENSRNELFKFLEHKNMPITDDGCFLAYKGVDNDYYSKTAGSIKVIKGHVQKGRIFNDVGEYIEVARGDVDPNINNGCSYGLHAGSFEYANDFKGDGRLMIVKINPRDCVSVPHDCSYQKLRTCAYEVIGEENRILSDVKDINYDKASKVRNAKKFNRDSLGRFC